MGGEGEEGTGEGEGESAVVCVDPEAVNEVEEGGGGTDGGLDGDE
jgi:hypothetical protein